VASFYNIGDLKTNIIHTKLRHRCSGLNGDLYRVSLKDGLRCVCGHLFEDAIHFFVNVHFISTIELLCLTDLITSEILPICHRLAQQVGPPLAQ
jgi:hypothetical protein